MRKIEGNLFSCWMSKVVQPALETHSVEKELVLFFSIPLLSVH